MQKESITLNRATYPLYVGGSLRENFHDWDGKGSTFLLEAGVESEDWNEQDIVWKIEDEDIVAFEKEDELQGGAKKRIRARRTGITSVIAELPDGSRAECIITVIDNYTRLTVLEIELNTPRLHLGKGEEAVLYPIFYPKDIYKNGMLDTRLSWNSTDEKVAEIRKGRITARGIGEADIIVASADTGRTACCHVTVTRQTGGKKYKEKQEEPFEKIVEMEVGERRKLPGNDKFIWKSDDRYSVSVDSQGYITAESPSLRPEVSPTGMQVLETEAPVRIYATDPEGGRVLCYWVNVKKPERPLHYADAVEEKTLKCIEAGFKKSKKRQCYKEEKEIDVDQVIQFRPEIEDSFERRKMRWICSDSSIVTVDREGNVQAYQEGTCKVYAIQGQEIYAVCQLKVRGGRECLRNLHVVSEAVTDNSVLLLWNRAALTDTGRFDRYQIFCDGEMIDEVRTLGYRFNNLESGRSYSLCVKAVDEHGTMIAEETVTTATKEKSRILNVLEYGAVGDGKHMDTWYIQRTVDACPDGGTVLLPKGYIFISGAIFLKSNMTFQVDGILIGSADPKDYPRVVSRWEGWRKMEQSAEEWANTTRKVPENHCVYASLINAGIYDEGERGVTGPYNLENLVICGKGQINGNGFSLAYNEGPNGNSIKVVSKEYPVKDATWRGSVIRIHNGRNIYVKDIQVAYGPGWTIHAIYCDHITFDGMEVVSQGDGDCGNGADILHCGHIFNGDGIDPESCTYANLFHIYFTTGDDAVAIKSGRGKEGNELDKPNAYIRVTDCISHWSLGGFGTGSETASGSHDLLFQNLKASDILVSGIWIKSCKERGGVTEDIQIRDVIAENCSSPVWITNAYTSTSVQANPADTPPTVRRITFENVHGNERNEYGFKLTGIPEAVISDIKFRNCTTGGRKNVLQHCENISGLSQEDE